MLQLQILGNGKYDDIVSQIQSTLLAEPYTATNEEMIFANTLLNDAIQKEDKKALKRLSTYQERFDNSFTAMDEADDFINDEKTSGSAVMNSIMQDVEEDISAEDEIVTEPVEKLSIEDVRSRSNDFKRNFLKIFYRIKEDNWRRLTEREFEKVELNVDLLEETMPLKYRLKDLVKEHGISIASITLMVGTIISTIATSLMQKAALLKAENAMKNNNKDTNDNIDKISKDTNDKIDKNDKEINDKIDILDRKKTLWDNIKQIDGYILATLSALLIFVGGLLKFIGSVAMGLGWILYLVIAADTSHHRFRHGPHQKEVIIYTRKILIDEYLNGNDRRQISWDCCCRQVKTLFW